jgi:hypothetical protein
MTTVGGILVTPCSAAGSGSGLPQHGLPRRLNPGIFVDPNTNDILIFVDTYKGAENYRESVRIADLPLDIPFRLGIVLQGRVLEVYLNCKLEVTKVLSGTPKTVENTWYGISGSAAAQAQIQNLSVWKMALKADDMSVLCKSPIAFALKRPICEGADTVISPQTATQAIGSAATAAAGADLGVKAALTCAS